MTAVAFPKPVKREKPARTPWQRSKPMRRTRMKHNLKTKQQLREVVFAPYAAWIAAEGKFCVACGTTVNIQGAHVGQGGQGMKHGTAADVIRLCGAGVGKDGCHSDHDHPSGCGFFAGWPRDRLRAWDREQRLAHWVAFSAWAGIEIRRLSLRGDDESAAACAALIDCDAMIAACVIRLGGGD